MTQTVREFDWSRELAMYAGTLICTLLVFAVAGGLIIGARYLLGSGRHRRSGKS